MTLVEVLVVAAMVGLMAALLVPGLGAAREKARVAVCAGQLRQLTQAALVYFDDHRTWPAGSVSGYFLWNGAQLVGAGHLLGQGSSVALARLFYCPAAQLFPPTAPETGVQNLGLPGKMTVGNYYYRGWSSAVTPRPESTVVAWLADICFAGTAGRNHGRGLNVGFSDGHVVFVERAGHWDITAAGAWEDLDALGR